MDGNARLTGLIEALQRDGRVDIAAMAAEFGTAEMTIRRDLDRIVGLGMARRVRGGAISLLMRGEELPFALRVLEHSDVKERIAAAVAGLLATARPSCWTAGQRPSRLPAHWPGGA